MKWVFWIIAALGLGSILIYQVSEQSPRVPEVLFESDSDRVIEVTGLPPQIAVLREIASDAGWNIVCEDTSGEVTTLHLAPGLWARINPDDEIAGELVMIAGSTSQMSRGQSERRGCNQPQTGTSYSVADGPESKNLPIAYGTREELGPVVEIANACGVKQARIRAFEPDEWELLGIEEDPSMFVFSVDDIANSSDAQLMCAGALINRHYAELENES